MKNSAKLLLSLVAFLAVIFALYFFNASLTNSPVGFRGDIDKKEAMRIFEIAKPSIDQLLGDSVQNMNYRISRFKRWWVVSAFHADNEFVPSGQRNFFIENDGRLLDFRDDDPDSFEIGD